MRIPAFILAIALSIAVLFTSPGCVDRQLMETRIAEIESKINEAKTAREALEDQLEADAAAETPKLTDADRNALADRIAGIDAFLKAAEGTLGTAKIALQRAGDPEGLVLGLGEVAGIFIPGAGAVVTAIVAAMRAQRAAKSLAEASVKAAHVDPSFATAVQANREIFNEKQTPLARKLIDDAQRRYRGRGA